MEIHGIEIDVQDEGSDTIKNILRGWREHETDFKGMLHNVNHDPNRKIYIGKIVFEKKDGNFILRRSSQS